MTDGHSCDRYLVQEEDRGQRLDLFLAARISGLSRSQIKRAVSEGRVLVNDSVSKAGACLKVGDLVLLRQEPPRPWKVEAEEIPLSVLFEDDCLLVINKPPGIVVHPGAGNARGTLVNALLFHCGDLSGVGGYLRPGIVHRLDKNTSGVMVIAKNDTAHQGLSRQFKDRRVVKHYRAVVSGSMPDDEGVIDAPIGRHQRDRKKMSTLGSRGREALTRWTVLRNYGGLASLLDVRIETGRTHQIRVHLNALGRPVLGDKEYGNKAALPDRLRRGSVDDALRTMNRQALHAATLGFFHPRDERYLEFTAPLPDDMAELLDRLESLVTVIGPE